MYTQPLTIAWAGTRPTSFLSALITVTGNLKDYATREILESILKDEDAHMDAIEEVQDQIGQMSLQIFLTTQVG